MSAPLVEAGILALGIALSFVVHRVSPLLVIPGLLLGGLVVGPHGLAFLADGPLLDAAGDIGLVLLLFFTSLFTHPRALRMGGRVALPLACYDLVLNFAVAYWIGALFGWDLPSRLILAGILSTSSTGTILTILSNEGRLLRREGNVLVALLWIEDLAFVAYFLFLSGHRHLESAGPSWNLAVAFVLFASFLAVLYAVRDSVWGAGTREILIPFVTGLGILGAWLGSLAGLPPAGAAFATGLVLAGSRGSRFVQTEAPHLRHVSLALFFLAFGATIDPAVARDVVPVALAALVGIVFTELLFLPQLARLLGLGAAEAFVLGGSLLSRGGKSASFARLGEGLPASGALQSVSGLLTLVLTPIAPLIVRLVLRNRKAERTNPSALQRRDVLSQVTRRVLASGAYAQRHIVSAWTRLAVAEWFLLLFLLGVLGSLLAFPWRAVPILVGLPLLVPAYLQTRRYFESVPGTPTTTYRYRGKHLPRLEAYLPALLLGPCLLVLVLPLVAPWASFGFPLATTGLLAGVFLLPRWVQPSASAPYDVVFVRRGAPRIRRSYVGGPR